MKRRLSKFSVTTILVATEIFIGAFASLLSLIVLIKLAVNIDSVQQFDSIGSTFLTESRSPLGIAIMQGISFLGHEMLLIFLVIVVILLASKKQMRDALLFLVTFITGGVVNILLKEYIARERPVDAVVQEIMYSFPSLHAMNSFVFYSLLVLFIYRFTRSRKYTLLSFVMGVIIVLAVGVSRVYLGAHFPSDVIAGYVAGLWWVATVLVIDKTLTLFSIKKIPAT